MSSLDLAPGPTTLFPHPDAFNTAPLLSNPSTDSSSSTDSHASSQLVTPRGSISGPDPVHVQHASADDALARPPPSKKVSSRSIRSKASFSSWRSPFHQSSIPLRSRPSQEETTDPLDASQSQPHEPGQFDDASSSSRSICTLSSADLHPHHPHHMRLSTSASMSPTASGSSDTSAGADDPAKGHTRKLISSLKRLGVSIRPTSFDRRGGVRITHSAAAITPPFPPSLADAPMPLRVSYALSSASVVGHAQPPISFAAFLPPDRAKLHEVAGPRQGLSGMGPGMARGPKRRGEDTMVAAEQVIADEAEEEDSARGLFSPPQPHSPIIRGIQGALSPMSDLDISSPKPAGSLFIDTRQRQAYPTPVLPSTACPSPTPTPPRPDSHSNLPTPTHTRACSPLEESIGREVGLPLPRLDSSRSIQSNLSASGSSQSIKSLHRLSALNTSTSTPTTRSPTPTGTGRRLGSTTPTNLTCTPVHSTPRSSFSGLPSAQSVQDLPRSNSLSGLRRHASLRQNERTPRGSPTLPLYNSPHNSSRTSLGYLSQPGPIPPSLIHTPKALEPPAHPISPVIGACPSEPNPIPICQGPGRRRATSGRWRLPNGMFELSGLGLGDLARGDKEEGKPKEKYEHVDTPGEFGLGAAKEKAARERGESPYF